MGRDEGDVRGGGLGVRGEAGGKGGVKDSEVGVEKGIGKRITAGIGQSLTPSRVVGIDVAEK